MCAGQAGAAVPGSGIVCGRCPTGQHERRRPDPDGRRAAKRVHQQRMVVGVGDRRIQEEGPVRRESMPCPHRGPLCSGRRSAGRGDPVGHGGDPVRIDPKPVDDVEARWSLGVTTNRAALADRGSIAAR